ncbi:MAG: DNA-3-methyladenine glycosylase 2 family protein [Clostridiales bacterium]|nr:DNA-3-methyladenine glycosylase 2 family protein [Clostridiales bacterium]
MKIEEFDDYILVSDLGDFNVEQTLECGQVFRFKKTDFGYVVYSLSHKADIYCQENTVKIVTKDKKYFIKYFDFYKNYGRIKSKLGKFPMLSSAIEYGSGIRILRSNPIEMIIEFIISQNNNIPRIKAIIEKICESYGENMGDYYAFPTIERLKEIPKEFFREIKCGYRDKYLYETIQAINTTFNVDDVYDMDTETARRELMKLKGVGRKVADCILLFGFGKTDVFPTDTWIVQAYRKIYNDDTKDAIQISKLLLEEFGDLAGYAQQYLYYYIRESNLGEKV